MYKRQTGLQSSGFGEGSTHYSGTMHGLIESPTDIPREVGMVDHVVRPISQGGLAGQYGPGPKGASKYSDMQVPRVLLNQEQYVSLPGGHTQSPYTSHREASNVGSIAPRRGLGASSSLGQWPYPLGQAGGGHKVKNFSHNRLHLCLILIIGTLS